MEVDSSMLSEPGHNHDQAGAATAEAVVEGTEVTEAPAVVVGGGSPVEEVQQSAVVGPRLAPNYTVVNAILEKKEDGPGPRCGHTLTAVAAVGEEGTPGYIGPRLILFGGATALEGNSAASGTPSSAGNAGIRMYLTLNLYLLLLSFGQC